MACENRTALADVIASNISHYSFYQLVELLYRMVSADAEQPQDIRAQDERVFFSATASTGFHKSDLVQISQQDDGCFNLEVAFLGLHGSQSPMPGYYLDKLAWEYAQKVQKVGIFLDFFHHRLLTLLYRIWRKHRYYIRFRNNGEDGFSRLMFALVGLAGEDLRRSLPVNHAKMLSYAGLIASPSRSPEVVAGIIRHCFDLEEAEVLIWQDRKIPIAREQQNCLSVLNSTLGENFVIGEKIKDCASKFILKLSKLTFLRFLQFLPSGDQFRSLVRFMSFIMRDQLAWDLRLCFDEKQARGMCLGDQQSVCLGWCCFLGQPPDKPCVTICVQE